MIAICQSYHCTVTGPCHRVEVSNHDMVYPFFSGGSHRFMLLTCTYVIKTTYQDGKGILKENFYFILLEN